LVHRVIGRTTRPSRREAVHDATKAKRTSELTGTDAHRDIDKGSRVSKDTEDDDEDYRSWYPRPELVGVHNLVAEESHEQSAKGDDEDSSEARDVDVDGVDQLRTYDRVDGRPPKAGKEVKDSDDLDSMPAKPVPGEDHLTQAKSRPEGGEVADRDDTEEVEEQAHEAGVNEA